MVTGVTSGISQDISMDIDEIDELLDAIKKKEAKNTTKELENLLIEYILARMHGDSTGEQAISDQISSLLNKYSGDMEKANELMQKLKTVANDPTKQTKDELGYLESLIGILKQDVKSGEMDGF